MSAEIGALSTERPNPRTRTLDSMTVPELLRVMNTEDASVASAVAQAIPDITRAVSAIVAARTRGGRLIYAGAGTSGRLGVLDAVECPPTFGTDPAEVVGLIAGGPGAFLQAVEGAEDDPGRAAADLADIDVATTDVVVALAASGRTPYAIGALDYARSVGAVTVSVSCNKGATLSLHADIGIEIVTGPEVLTGSTRLKAGTAQKLVCNMLSTATMIRSGRVFGNLMVDMTPTNAKLVDRAHRIIVEATGVDDATAAALLRRADGHAKTAIVMQLTGLDADSARQRITASNGFVREAIRMTTN